MDGNALEEYVYNWSIRFPLDRWWRLKHNIPFGSSQHRDISFIDQLLEYNEELIYIKFKNSSKNKYIAGTGDWLVKRKMEQADIDEAFDLIKI